MNLIYSEFTKQAPAALRTGLKTFTRVLIWRPEPPPNAPLPFAHAWELAKMACQSYLKPEAVIHQVAARSIGKHSYLAVLVEVPSDKDLPAGEHYFHLKKNALSHMAVRGHKSLTHALTFISENTQFFTDAAHGKWPKCGTCGAEVYHTTDVDSPYFRRCMQCVPPSKIA